MTATPIHVMMAFPGRLHPGFNEGIHMFSRDIDRYSINGEVWTLEVAVGTEEEWLASSFGGTAGWIFSRPHGLLVGRRLCDPGGRPLGGVDAPKVPVVHAEGRVPR